MSITYTWQKMVKKLIGKGNPAPKDISDWLNYSKENKITPEIKQYDLDILPKKIGIDVYDAPFQAIGYITVQFGDKEINFQENIRSGFDESELKKQGNEELNKYISKIEHKIQKILKKNKNI